jgi:GNAT superfamily N-acetyltransferase
MAIKGIWCSGRRIPTLLEDLRAVALSNGLRRLLSPLLPAQAARPYKKAGMTAVDEIVVMRTDPRRVRTAPPPVCGVDVRVAFDEDLDGVLAVDASAFEEFWRYDRDMLSEFSRDERLAVAEAGSEIVGYTLSTVRRGVGSIGRLAVRSDRQGLGIGKMMLEDSLKYLAACGAERATLCTQCDNARSRRLYAGAGFETMPGILLGLLSEPF